VTRQWLVTASRADRQRREQEQRRSSVSDGEEEKWETPSPVVPTRGIRPASPCGVVTGKMVGTSRSGYRLPRLKGKRAADMWASVGLNFSKSISNSSEL
jgi:hypothetical protein